VRIQRAERIRGTRQLTFTDIAANLSNLGGFDDADVVAGRRYVYMFALEAVVDGQIQESPPTRREIEVPVPLDPITDLAVTRTSPDSVDLQWTPVHPSLDVRIYCTTRAPRNGITERPVEVSALDRPEQGLPREGWLFNPVRSTPDGMSGMTHVEWPQGSAHAYFTPVTVQGGWAVVGPSQMRVNLPPVEHVRVVERTFKQVLTFAWPEGAVAVAVATMPRPAGEVRPEAVTEALQKTGDYIERDQYKRHGGKAYFRLGGEGCRLYLAPVAVHAKKRYTGEPVFHDYPGLIRLKYGVLVKEAVGGRPQDVYLTIVAERGGVEGLDFTLLHHPDRLPLHIGDQDCRPVEMRPTNALPGATGGDQFRTGQLPKIDEVGPAAWKGAVAGLGGFLRLFVRATDYRGTPVALLDPPVTQLRLDPPGGRR
jgi:hypothetical protein